MVNMAQFYPLFILSPRSSPLWQEDSANTMESIHKTYHITPNPAFSNCRMVLQNTKVALKKSF